MREQLNVALQPSQTLCTAEGNVEVVWSSVLGLNERVEERGLVFEHKGDETRKDGEMRPKDPRDREEWGKSEEAAGLAELREAEEKAKSSGSIEGCIS